MKKQVKWVIESSRDHYEFILPEPCSSFSIGRRENTDIQVSECPDLGELNVRLQDNSVNVICNDHLDIQDGGCFVSSKEVLDDHSVDIVDKNKNKCFIIQIQYIDYGKAPTYDRCIELSLGRILFGNTETCQVVFPCIGKESVAFEINMTGADVSVLAHSTSFGVYLNNDRLSKLEKRTLRDGDYVFCCNGTFMYKRGMLYSTTDIVVAGLPYTDSYEQNSHLIYPRMNRTSRYHEVPPMDKIEVLDPPAMQERENRNIFLTIMPTIFMAVLIVFMRGSFSSTGGMMLFSVLSMGVGAAGSTLTYFETSKNYKKKLLERERNYKKYIKGRRKEIAAYREKENKILNQIYISPDREIQNVAEFSADLFDRTQGDADFLDIRFGYGLIPSSQKIVCKKHEVFEQTDDLFNLPGKLADEFEYNDGLPVTVHAQTANAIGVQGTLTSLQNILNQTVLDVVTRQHPEDVFLYFFCGPEFKAQLESYRMLPHLWDEKTERRNIAHDSHSKDKLLEKLYKEMSIRAKNSESLGNAAWIVVFIYADDEITHHPIMKYIDRAADLKVVFVFLAQYREELPLGCKYTIKLFSNEEGGQLIDMYNREDDRVFKYDVINNDTIEAVSKKLAPLYSEGISLSALLVSSLSFYDMLNLKKADESIILDAWRSADPRESLAAPLGVVAGGSPLYLDLHEKAQGPHGLVAGTTGSGKSELLISYVLSMAYHYSPDDVTFVVIDFKGNGLAGPLKGLPHLIGTITNLDKSEIERSLLSIRAENLRRQRLFDECSTENNEIKNINEYTTAYRLGKVTQPLPHLIIIVDEFAELKAQQPEFMDELISTSRIGRSLGVHLILATQKPSGVVNDQIWSNSDFKICLRVQTQEDSNEVLKSPLAAEIREPGRAYLQVSREESLTLFQSGYSGAVIEADDDETPFSIERLSLSGEPSTLYVKKRRSSKGSLTTQLSEMKTKIVRAFEEGEFGKPSMLCLPPLEDRIDMPSVGNPTSYKVQIGVYDQPTLQKQNAAILDLLEGNVIIVGASQSGKTNFLQVILRQAASNIGAHDASVYIMDFNTGVFKTMEMLSCIGGVALMDQQERVKNLFKILLQEVELRKEKLIDANVTSFRAYREAKGTDMPLIILMIDNMAIFNDMYGEEYDDELITLLREGQAVGIVCIATVAQANLVGMRRLCYFNQRIALHMQDQTDVSIILDGCRKNADEIPGRAIWKLEKEYLEMQIYSAFAGETEQERNEEAAYFVKENSAQKSVRIIPEVPMHLTEDVMTTMFGDYKKDRHFVFGMSYDDVEPVSIDVGQQFELALVGKNTQGKNRYLEMMINDAIAKGNINIYIIDHYDRALSKFAEESGVKEYTLDFSRASEILASVYEKVKDRLDDVRENGSEALEKYPLEIVIINTREAISKLSNDSASMQIYNDLQNQYKLMKILLVFADIDNRFVNYNSPAILRNLKENRRALLFEGLSVGKMFEFDSSTVREYRGALGRDEMFYIDDSEVKKVKMIW